MPFLFYEKMGFVLQRIVPDRIVSEIDEYFMELKLDTGKRKELKLHKTGIFRVKPRPTTA